MYVFEKMEFFVEIDVNDNVLLVVYCDWYIGRIGISKMIDK